MQVIQGEVLVVNVGVLLSFILFIYLFIFLGGMEFKSLVSVFLNFIIFAAMIPWELVLMHAPHILLLWAYAYGQTLYCQNMQRNKHPLLHDKFIALIFGPPYQRLDSILILVIFWISIIKRTLWQRLKFQVIYLPRNILLLLFFFNSSFRMFFSNYLSFYKFNDSLIIFFQLYYY